MSWLLHSYTVTYTCEGCGMQLEAEMRNQGRGVEVALRCSKCGGLCGISRVLYHTVPDEPPALRDTNTWHEQQPGTKDWREAAALGIDLGGEHEGEAGGGRGIRGRTVQRYQTTPLAVRPGIRRGRPKAFRSGVFRRAAA